MTPITSADTVVSATAAWRSRRRREARTMRRGASARADAQPGVGTGGGEGVGEPAFELVVVGGHDAVPSKAWSARSSSRRSALRARDAWLFTVPGEQSRVRAISASDRSS